MHDITATGIFSANGGFWGRLHPLGQSTWMADHWPQILWWIVPVVAIIAAFYLWNAALRREVQRRTGDLQVSRAEIDQQTQRLLALVTHFPDAILFETTTREVKQINQKFCSMFDIPAQPEALLGADCRQAAEQVKHLFVDPDGFIQRIDEIVAAQQPIWGEELPLLDGRTLARDYVPVGETGHIEHLWHYRDISGSKRTEDALREQERNYTSFFNTIDDLLFVLDEQGNILWTNQTVTDRLGYSRAELTGQSVLSVHPPEWRDEAGRIVADMLAGKAEYCPIPLRTKDGRYIPVETRVTQGQWSGRDVIFGVTKDISSLKASEEKLSKAFRAIPALIAISEFETGRFLDVNDAFLQTLGYQRDEVIGRTSGELGIFASSDDRPTMLKTLEESGALKDHPATVCTKTGQQRLGLFSAERLRLQSRNLMLTVMQDITERQFAEEALRESETKYRRLFMNAPVGIIIADTQGNVTSANPAVLALLGSPSEEATRAINVLTFPPLVKAGVSDAIRRCLAGESLVMEYPYMSAWGKLVFARLRLTPVLDDAGQVESTLGIIEDITDRRQAEDALRESEQRFRELFGLFRAISDNMTDMLWAKNLNKEYIFANQAICDQLLLATDTDEPLGKTDLFFAERERARHPDDPNWHTFGEICRDSDQVILDTKVPGRFDEFGNVQGEFLFLDVRKSPLFDENGTMIGVVGSARDVTAEKAMQEQLKQSEEKFRTLADEILDGVSVTMDGKNYWVNNAFAEIFGYTKEELIGQEADFVIVPEEVPKLLRQMRHRLAGETAPTQYETRAKRKDGKIINLDVSAQIIQFEGKQAVQVVVRDITAQKAMERQLIQQERMAAVGQLTAGIAHDFNNILAGILGYAELMQLSPETPATLQPDLERIITSGERAAHLVRQLLDFSRKSMRQPKRLDLADFTGKAMDFLKRTLPETIQINLDYSDNGDMMVEADPDQLHQLLVNLSLNAKDAMPSGGNLTVRLKCVELEAENCLTCGKTVSGQWVCLSMSDTGHGISPDALPHILEPFFTTREVGQGTGLGLAQVSGIVSQNQGHLSVESEPGQGTSVAIYLPPITKDSGAGDGLAKSDPSHHKHGRGQTVLLIEDNPIVREVNQTMLERLNYRALVAANGTEALAIFADHKDDIALVLSDMVMPDIGGEALFHSLKKQNPRLKMVIMSGYPLGEDDIDALLDAGIAAWVEKPLSLSKMAQIVGEIIPPKRKGRWA